MGYAVLFPGQGSQAVGMGEGLFELCPQILGKSADDVLGWSLRSVCLEGPSELLVRTEYAQPAIFAISYALWALFEPQLGDAPVGAAGHSLGEYTALTAAGVLGYEEALALVADRGRAMSRAADESESGMSALLGADVAKAEEVVAASRDMGGSLQIANINAPGQVVVAGSKSDLSWLESNSRDFGVRRVIALEVAGAFHSSFMSSAAEQMKGRLDSVAYGDAGLAGMVEHHCAAPRVGATWSDIDRTNRVARAFRREPVAHERQWRRRFCPCRPWRRDCRHGSEDGQGSRCPCGQ